MAQREYEFTVILRPDLTTEQVRNFRDRLAGIVAQRQGIVLHNIDLGKRTLAYEIDKQKRGHYLYYNFVAEGDLVAELERICRLDETVFRFLSIVTNDHVNLAARQAGHDADLKKLDAYFGMAPKPDVVAAAVAAPAQA